MTTPSELGLPEKFQTFRPGQEESALKIVGSDKRFTLLDAPTGSGKSLMYMTAAMLAGGRSLVLVGTKGLQSQILDDFKDSFAAF